MTNSYTNFIDSDITQNIKPTENKMQIQSRIVDVIVKAVGYYIVQTLMKTPNHYATIKGNRAHFENYIIKVLQASPNFDELKNIDFEVTTQNVKIKSDKTNTSPSGEYYNEIIYISVADIRNAVLKELRANHPDTFQENLDNEKTYR